MQIRRALFPLVLCLPLIGAQAQTAITKDQIEGYYDADMARCEDHSGQHREYCEQRAKAARDGMMERIDEVQSSPAEQRAAAQEAATQKCDSMQGAARQTCIDEAKASVDR